MLNRILKYLKQNNLDFQNKFENLNYFVNLMHTLPKNVLSENIELLNKILFNKDKHKNTSFRILIHLPSINISPGGYSIFNNIYENLKHMGVSAHCLKFDDDLNEILHIFKPTIFLSSDDIIFTNNINWELITEYKKNNNFKIGLTASISAYGNTDLIKRIEWAHSKIDFYYSFRAKEYVESREDYIPFFKFGYKIINIEFGANILNFFPLKEVEKKFDYLFFGSINPTKTLRYKNYFSNIVKNHHGYIYGNGWPWSKVEIPFQIQNYYYPLTRIGLNLHLDEQIEWCCELNERTYILGITKTPQLIDMPALLDKRYNINNMFCAHSAQQYEDLFNYMLLNEEECKYKSDLIFLETLEKHTMFDRIDHFLEQLKTIYD